jgi:hypothetical protein
MKETAMLDIALHQHGICGIPTIASKSTLTPTPTLTSRARSMEQAHPVRALEGPNISAIVSHDK